MTGEIVSDLTLGQYVAHRLKEIGVDCYFTVPGDFNLTLLDQLSTELQLVGCCNELNAGFAANGYARVKGVGVVVCTLFVGGLALASAVAGAYADRTPVIFISGTINSKDVGSDRVIHHTIGLEDKDQTLDMLRAITAHSIRITNTQTASLKIDQAIHIALKERLPVYIEICCNLATQPILVHPEPFIIPVLPDCCLSSMNTACQKIAEELWRAEIPVVVIGPQFTQHGVRHHQQSLPFLLCALCQLLPHLVIVGLPSAKSTLTALVVEGEHSELGYTLGSRCIGQLWSTISQPSQVLHRLVDAPDVLHLHLGVAHNDYVTLHGSALVECVPKVYALGGGNSFKSRRLQLFEHNDLKHEWQSISLPCFLKVLVDSVSTLADRLPRPVSKGLLGRLRPKVTGEWYGFGSKYQLPKWVSERNAVLMGASPDASQTSIGGLKGYIQWVDSKEWDPDVAQPIRNRQLIEHWQAMVGENMTWVVDTGDAWFMTQKLVLPMGCRYEIQMQYGSIGWSVGAILGVALAQRARRVVGVIGDGAFQVAAQEMSTMLRQRLNPILFVLNNGQYVIEVCLHE